MVYLVVVKVLLAVEFGAAGIALTDQSCVQTRSAGQQQQQIKLGHLLGTAFS